MRVKPKRAILCLAAIVATAQLWVINDAAAMRRSSAWGGAEVNIEELSYEMVSMVSAIVVVPTAAAKLESVTASVGIVDSIEMMPRDIQVKENTINDKDGLDYSRKLNSSNGKYVNFDIENLGKNPVVATINGKEERTFQPGEKGHIDMEVTQGFFGGDKTYTFKAVAGKNGGTVHIHYVIDQRDVQP